MSVPGERLYRFARHVCGDATVSRLIDPWRADFAHELGEAIASGRRVRALLVRVEYTRAFLRLIVTGVVLGDGVASMLKWQVGSAVVWTAVFLLPFVRTLAQSPSEDWLVLLAYLTPSALMIGLPLGASVGLVFSMRRRRPSAEVRAAAMAVAVMCTASTAILDTGVLPRSNQAFRQTAARPWLAGRRLLRGFNEMTPSELWRAKEPQAKRYLYQRAFVTFAPFALVPCLLGLLTYHRRGRALCAVVMAVYCLHIGSANILLRSSPGPLATFLIIWAPNIALAAFVAAARLGGVWRDPAS